jgi:RimJ/RimL family protein N-acetyltransferase
MRIKYRKLKLDDSEKIRIWRNKQLSILRQNQIINKDQQFTYFKKEILSRNDKIKLFAIDLDKNLIAYGGLVNISKDFGTAEISFIADKKISHNSKFYEILFGNFLDFIKKYSFKKKNLRRLFTETYSFRKKHIKILEKYGFKLEGVMKKHVLKNNRIYDSLIHGKLNR